MSEVPHFSVSVAPTSSFLVPILLDQGYLALVLGGG